MKYNDHNDALKAKDLDSFLEAIHQLRKQRGLLTTDKTFRLIGVFDYVDEYQNELISPNLEKIESRMKVGTQLLDSIFCDKTKRKDFLNFSLNYHYTYTHAMRLSAIAKKLACYIQSDTILMKKNSIHILDVGSAPKALGSPTSKTTLDIIKTKFPEKDVFLTSVDVQFPKNFLFDKEGKYVDSKTGIVYKYLDIKENFLSGFDIVIAANVVDLYEDVIVQKQISKNIFKCSEVLAIYGIRSEIDIFRKSFEGSWKKIEKIILREGWYQDYIYKKLDLISISCNNSFLRSDISINYAWINPLTKFLSDVKHSYYNIIFRYCILAFIRGELNKRFLTNRFLNWIESSLKNSKEYCNKKEIMKNFASFVKKDRRLSYYSLKKSRPETPEQVIIFIKEVINLYVLYAKPKKLPQNPAKKILLLQPRVESFKHIPGHLPIGLATLAACISDKKYLAKLYAHLCILPDVFEEFIAHSTTINLIDFQVESSKFNFKQFIKDSSPDIVGIRTVSASIDEANKIACMVRNTLGSRVVILFGGIHITALAKKIITENHNIVDIGFLGEAEETWPHYFIYYITKKLNLADIGGLCYRGENGNYIEHPIVPPQLTLDDYPSHVDYFSLLKTKDVYATLTEYCIHGMITSKMALMLPSRGCLTICSFCPTHKLWNTRVIRRQSTSRVLDDMSKHYKQGKRIFYFRDDNFTANKHWLIELCKKIICCRWKIAWCCMSRVDTVDMELLEVMKNSGLASIAFGVESGSTKILDKMKKRITPFEVRNASAMCQKLDIRYKLYYMVGYPGETWLEIFSSMMLMIDSLIGFKNFNIQYEKYQAKKKGCSFSNIYTKSFNKLCHFLWRHPNKIRSYINKNLLFPDQKIMGTINVSYVVPYPGSDLYSQIGKEIFMVAKRFKHGPEERNNLDDFRCPIETNDMCKKELERARALFIKLYNAIETKQQNEVSIILKQVR